MKSDLKSDLKSDPKSDPKSDVAHYEGLTYWGPIHPSRMESILDLLELGPGDRALDLGCGRAELLLRLVERFGLAAIGVDRSEAAIRIATEEAARRVPGAQLELSAMDVAELSIEPASLDHLSWIGGPFLGAGLRETFGSLATWLRPGGTLLVGQGFWEREPPADYLAATGIPAEELGAHFETIALGREVGLTLLYTTVSHRDEWDAFEGRILYNWEGMLAASPEDPELRAKVERKRAWNDAQQRWGRGTMGFGLYLFRKGM